MSATAPHRMSTAINALVHAFHDDPLYRWLIPDPARRPAFLSANFELILELAAAFGEVHISEDDTAVAVWTNPGIDLLPDPAPFVELLQRWAPQRVDDALAGMGASQSHQPPAARTLHLLGVHPRRQGQGIAASLIQPVLNGCDEDGTTAYLESSNTANLSFYRRCGFEVIAEVAVPGGGPTMRPMERRRSGSDPYACPR